MLLLINLLEDMLLFLRNFVSVCSQKLPKCNKPDNRHAASKFHHFTTTTNLTLVSVNENLPKQKKNRQDDYYTDATTPRPVAVTSITRKLSGNSWTTHEWWLRMPNICPQSRWKRFTLTSSNLRTSSRSFSTDWKLETMSNPKRN